MGRVGTVQDVAGVVLFCATSMADYLNGATLDVIGACPTLPRDTSLAPVRTRSCRLRTSACTGPVCKS